MTLKLIETAITETHCQMRYADHVDPEQATEWVEVRAKLSDLTHPSGTALPKEPINLTLAALQSATLRQLQTLATDEIHRLVVEH